MTVVLVLCTSKVVTKTSKLVSHAMFTEGVAQEAHGDASGLGSSRILRIVYGNADNEAFEYAVATAKLVRQKSVMAYIENS